jgi:hypothetical protein
MPSIRIGFSTDFNLVGEQVGIGTENPTATLEVAGTIIADNTAGSGGVSTLTTYDGFLQSLQVEANTVSIAETTKGNLNSLSGEIKISGEVTVTGDTPVAGGRLESLTVTDSFDLPHGGSEYKDDAPEKGTTRFNQDLGQLEFYTGLEWRTVGSYADTGNRGRGVWMGGEDIAGATETETNDYVNISTLGNSINFGDLSTGNRSRLETAGASSIRGVFGGGRTEPGSNTDIIDYITIASEGNAIDFGNAQQTTTPQNGGTKSSSTRGVFGGGTPTELQYIQISTLGNSLTFGNLTKSNGSGGSSASSPTRAVYAAGGSTESIEAITFASTGTSEAFGDCPTGKTNSAGAGNSVRGVFGGAYLAGDRKSNAIEYVTLATLGNAIDFGDLTIFRACLRACSTQVRAVFGGGYFTPSTTASGGTADNRIDYITIATTGNAQDFGDLASGNIHSRGAALSDSHGGLGGF